MRWVVPGLVILVALLVPSDAWAWGPFTHLLLSRTVAGGAALLPPGVASIITAFAAEFSYGSLAADIVVGKNLASYLQHAHNWQNVFQLLRTAETPAQRAFGLGYLAHLAADTVAHNYFIPLKLIESFPATFLKHTYWEARFDKRAYPLVADAAGELMGRRFPECDRLHEQCIAGTLFKFRTNKRIFDSVFLFQNLARWQRAVAGIEQRSPFALTAEERQELVDMSLAAIRAFLWKLEESPVTRIDPRGDEAIRQARIVRRELKRLLRRGALRADQTQPVGAYYRAAFRTAAEQPRFEVPGFVPLLTRLRDADAAARARGERVPANRRPVLRRMVEAVRQTARNGRTGGAGVLPPAELPLFQHHREAALLAPPADAAPVRAGRARALDRLRGLLRRRAQGASQGPAPGGSRP